MVVCYRHPGDNPFYSNIDSMPDIRPRRKSIPLVSDLVRHFVLNSFFIKKKKSNVIFYIDVRLSDL